MTGTGSSLERAFREQCDRGFGGGPMDADQLDMLRGGDGRLPDNVFQLVRQGKAAGPGRPRGAINKRTQKIAELICQRGGDPLLYLADVYAMPLDQLVELMRIADGAKEQEQLLHTLAVHIQAQVDKLVAKTTLGRDDQRKLDALVDKLSDIAKVLRNKPGALAAAAMQLQAQAARTCAEYVHGKQPVSVHVQGKADLVMVIPGLNAPADAAGDVARLVEKHGIDAIDFDNMKLVSPVEGDGEQEDE